MTGAGALFANDFREFETGHDRHCLIGDDKVDIGLHFERRQRPFDRNRLYDFVTEIFEHRRHVHENQSVIVNGKDFERDAHSFGFSGTPGKPNPGMNGSTGAAPPALQSRVTKT